MSDAPAFGTPGWKPPQPGNPDDPVYQAHAATAVGQVLAPDQGIDAGESIDAIKQQAVRAALSDFEAQLNDTLKKSQAAFSSQQDQIDLLTRQLATVSAKAGPPTATLLAQSLATRIQSIATANPDLGAKHFAGVLGQAQNLADEVKDVAAGNTDSGRAEQLANGIGAWFTRVHARTSGKFLEGAGAALDEAERILDELPNLLPAAAALTRAV
jgi:ABC-type transporter Mla subunit MlaD